MTQYEEVPSAIFSIVLGRQFHRLGNLHLLNHLDHRQLGANNLLSEYSFCVIQVLVKHSRLCLMPSSTDANSASYDDAKYRLEKNFVHLILHIGCRQHSQVIF